jgi:hypothetical protein
MNHRTPIVVCTILVTLLIPDLAFGYLDPGTGSIILQVLVAGVLGAMFTIKNLFRRVKGAVSRVFRCGSTKEHRSAQ